MGLAARGKSSDGAICSAPPSTASTETAIRAMARHADKFAGAVHYRDDQWTFRQGRRTSLDNRVPFIARAVIPRDLPQTLAGPRLLYERHDPAGDIAGPGT